MAPVTETEPIDTERGAHQSFDAQPDCEICSKILLCVSQANTTREKFTLGIAEDLLRSECSHVVLFKDWVHKLLKDDQQLTKSSLVIDEAILEHGLKYFKLQCSPGSDGRHYVSDSIGLLLKLTEPDHPGVMRAIDPQWVDVGLVKHWITTCDATHGAQCRQSSWLSHLGDIRPKYLVDTLEMCVVEGARVKAGYVALSYQWGQIKTLRNTIEMRDRLFKPSSLSSWDLARYIPQTITDAFAIVKLLGYRYLWVDTLCVVSTCIYLLFQGKQQLT